MHHYSLTDIAQAAAALIVEEGMEFGPAKKRAAKQLGLRTNTALPDNVLVEEAVREYIALFKAEEQPQELYALRCIAHNWMLRLQEFAPLLGGAVWNGTATRFSNIHLQLFCDDIKALPIWLLNQGLHFETEETSGISGLSTEVLILEEPTPEPCLDSTVLICLWNNASTAQRGALQPGPDGRALRGPLSALESLMAECAAP
ncbi:hypothetical protein E9531_08945 [Lampropedia puyangensis]|uniref:Uncharacterized protein n=1 Tax=Lampropedia puyangensis TaxID=1330072 RepID=A0A4S8F5P9_9BURK|nr:hypothetical protein [Lampropedia puyangensis]THU01484.1 hypothetical protein E9531_08945 [Lampropedia puyangensis]